MAEYQARTRARIVEILRAQDQNPRSWQAEAAFEIERMEKSLKEMFLLACASNDIRPDAPQMRRAGAILAERP